MSSIFQQLYMQPTIRRLVLGAPAVPEAQAQDSVFHQLQASRNEELATRNDEKGANLKEANGKFANQKKRTEMQSSIFEVRAK